MDTILRINMGADGGPAVKTEPLGDYAGFGGRGLTSAIVSKEVPPLCHPVGEDNKLVIAPGLLSGSTAAMSGRLSIGCKSPLTGGIKEANAGGMPSQMLGRLGYAAIVLEGKPKDNALYKILINKDGVDIQEANDLCMLGNYDTVDKIKAEHGEKVSCISIGQAGEMKMAAASIACTDMEQRPTRHAGRGGVGAVMGSKGVKVIVIDDAGMKMRQAKDPEAFKEANKAWVAGLKKHALTGEALPAYGTNVLTNVINEAGAYPTNNFQTGQFEGANNISGETQAETEDTRGGKGSSTHGCHRGCIIRCSGTFYDKNGKYVSKQPEYETVWAHGGNCGIDDLDAIAQIDRLDDDYGLDTIEIGAAIGVAMEAGLAEFGDAEAAINFVKEIGQGTPMGRILGGGAGATGKAYGIERVPVVKNQAMPAYDPRAVQGIGVTYATTTMGADHTAGYSVTANVLAVGGKVDPLKPFIAFAILDQADTFDALVDLLNAFTGQSWTGDDLVEQGKAILKMERDFNFRAGMTEKDDRLPEYFKKEKLAPHNIVFAVKDEDLDQVHNW
jgi:aldehyde:ferredoxin oxidoreductase